MQEEDSDTLALTDNAAHISSDPSGSPHCSSLVINIKHYWLGTCRNHQTLTFFGTFDDLLEHFHRWVQIRGLIIRYCGYRNYSSLDETKFCPIDT